MRHRESRGPVNEALARHAALLRQTEAWEKSPASPEEITVYDARRLLRVDEYSSPRRRKKRVQAVTNIAAHDDGLSALVAFLHEQFPEEWA